MSSKDVDFKIVDLILSNGSLPKESRNDPVFHECIHELSTLPMYRLSTEPSYLRDYHRRIIEENYKLACDNYSTFIQTAECTKMIFKDFEDVENKNEIMLNKIPNFVNSCNNFVEKCRKSISMANMNSLTLKNHNQILEILEIPQLLEACIRNNYLDEALEMIAHMRKLERRHQNIGIIMNVAFESRLAAQKLLDQLFQQLGGNLQLPVCLKIVGYLRRMDCLPDCLLRLKFLQCRDNYLKNLLRSLSRSDAFFHATKYMEITRVNLFDIATQYRAVFNDDDLYVTNPDAEGNHQGMLFSSWLVMRIRNFMVNLAEDLELIVQNSVDYNHASHTQSTSNSSSQSVGSKLQSLLGQAMYFGLSLSRIGSDFRALLMPMFYQAILKYIDLRLCQIPDSFSDCISSYKWTVNADQEENSNINTVMQVNDEIFRNQKSDEIIAPNKLMNHPLLAMLLNQLLSILEDIRLCSPRVLKQRICESFASSIDRLMDCLVRFYQEESCNFSVKENQSYMSMTSAFICALLPHINLCLSVLFTGDSAVTSQIGTVANCALDLMKLSNNFRSVLPDSFFLTELEDDLTGAPGDDEEEDQAEKLSKLSRSRESSLRVEKNEAEQILIIIANETADVMMPATENSEENTANTSTDFALMGTNENIDEEIQDGKEDNFIGLETVNEKDNIINANANLFDNSLGNQVGSIFESEIDQLATGIDRDQLVIDPTNREINKSVNSDADVISGYPAGSEGIIEVVCDTSLGAHSVSTAADKTNDL